MSISLSPSQLFTVVRVLASQASDQTLIEFWKEPLYYQNDAIVVERAYYRFEREFEFYSINASGLSEVRKYHRLLIDAIRDFNKSERLADRANDECPYRS